MDIPTLLSDNRVPFFDGRGHHHCRPGWLQLDCPYCGNNSGKFHLGFNKDRHYFVCWKCGGLPLIKTIADILRIPYKKAAAICKDLDAPALRTEITIARGTLRLPLGLGDLLPQHIAYAESRKLNIQQLTDVWHVRGLGVASRLSWRLFIPIEFRGEVVSWTTRSIKPSATLRYIAAAPEEEILPRTQLLYGADLVRHAVVITEGPADVWAIGPGAVCTFGTGYSQGQLLQLVEYPIRYVCYDSEPAAQRRAEKLVNDLSAFPGETYNIVLDAKDAGSATEKELRKLRKATGLEDYYGG